MSQGIPIVYQGSEFLFNGGDDPYNREPVWPALNAMKYENSPNLVDFLRRLNRLREIAGEKYHRSQQNLVWSNDDLHLFMRGDVLVVCSNVGSGKSFSRQITLPGELSSRMVNVLDSSGRTQIDFVPKKHSSASGVAGFFGYSTSDTGKSLNSAVIRINRGEPQVFYPVHKLKQYWSEFFQQQQQQDNQ